MTYKSKVTTILISQQSNSYLLETFQNSSTLPEFMPQNGRVACRVPPTWASPIVYNITNAISGVSNSMSCPNGPLSLWYPWNTKVNNLVYDHSNIRHRNNTELLLFKKKKENKSNWLPSIKKKNKIIRMLQFLSCYFNIHEISDKIKIFVWTNVGENEGKKKSKYIRYFSFIDF